MNNWIVYLLKCSDGSLYCGTTNKTIEERIAVHNSGKGSKYTRGRLPVALAVKSHQMNKSDAYKLEYKIKRLPPGKKEAYLRDLN